MVTMTQTIEDVHQIDISVDWPPGHVCTYLVDGAEPVLVDAGMAGEDAFEELQDGLDAAGRSIDEIEHLVLTHPHVDHIGQVGALRERANPRIYAPEGAQKRLSRDGADLEAAVRSNARAAGLTGEACKEAVQMSVESLERNRGLLDPETVDEWVEDDEKFSVGDLDLTAIHTPGHQADHFCFDTVIDNTPALFAGDMAMEPFRAVLIHTGLDNGVEEAIPAFNGALNRLDSLGERRVFPGHGPVHGRLGEMVERSHGSIARLLDGARKHARGGTTVLDLAKSRSNDRSFHYVLPESFSALAHLDETGEVESTFEGEVRQFLAHSA